MAKTNENLLKVESIIRGEGLDDQSSNLVISNAYVYACNNNLIYFKNDVLLQIACGMNEHISVEVVDKLNDLFNEIGLEGIRTLIYDLLSGKGYGPRTFIESSNNYLSELSVDYEAITKDSETKDIKIDTLSKNNEKLRESNMDLLLQIYRD